MIGMTHDRHSFNIVLGSSRLDVLSLATYSNLIISLPEFLRISCLGKLKVCLSVINVGPFYFTCMTVKSFLFLFEVVP